MKIKQETVMFQILDYKFYVLDFIEGDLILPTNSQQASQEARHASLSLFFFCETVV